MLRLISALALTLSFTACDKKDDAGDKKDDKKSADKKGDAKGGDAKGDAKADAGPAKKAWLKVEKFGVQLEVPEGATVSDGAGTSVMIMSPTGGCTVMLSKKDDMSFFQTYEKTIEDIEKGQMGKKKDMLKNEKTDDSNWVIHYTKESMTDPAKTQYGVDVRKKVGDGEYSCSRIENSEADAQCVLDACMSLKP